MWHIIYVTPANRYILDEDESTWIGAGTKGESINFKKKHHAKWFWYAKLLSITSKQTHKILTERYDLHRWRKKEVKVLVKKCEAGKYELYQNIADIFVYTVMYILSHVTVQYNSFGGIINFRYLEMS